MWLLDMLDQQVHCLIGAVGTQQDLSPRQAILRILIAIVLIKPYRRQVGILNGILNQVTVHHHATPT
jgi:hypothetical protein